MRLRRNRHLAFFRVVAASPILMASMIFAAGNSGTGGEEGRENPDKIASEIQRGAPDVIPVLRRWITQESDANTVGQVNAKVVMALQGLTAYRDTTSVELVSYFYRNAPLGSATRQIAADALASIGAKQSLPDLKAIVTIRQRHWDHDTAADPSTRGDGKTAAQP